MRQGEWPLKTMGHGVGSGVWRGHQYRPVEVPQEGGRRPGRQEEKTEGGKQGQRCNPEGGFLKSPRCFSNVPAIPSLVSEIVPPWHAAET